jgi:hypothetical protein
VVEACSFTERPVTKSVAGTHRVSPDVGSKISTSSPGVPDDQDRHRYPPSTALTTSRNESAMPRLSVSSTRCHPYLTPVAPQC